MPERETVKPDGGRSQTSASSRSRRTRRLVAAVVIAAAAVGAAAWPVTTSVGYNYKITTKRLTLFEKAVAFVDRDLEMRRLTREIAGTGGTPEQRLLRMYEWVRENIHPVPPGLLVIDDHVLYTFVRRYGAPDQRAISLAALASYDGMPGGLLPLGKTRRLLVQLTVVKIGDRLLVFDVNNRAVFRLPSGELATLNDMIADPSIIKAAAPGVMVDGAPYDEHFERLREARPNFLYAAQQRMWPRLKNELAARLHVR